MDGNKNRGGAEEGQQEDPDVIVFDIQTVEFSENDQPDHNQGYGNHEGRRTLDEPLISASGYPEDEEPDDEGSEVQHADHCGVQDQFSGMHFLAS